MLHPNVRQQPLSFTFALVPFVHLSLLFSKSITMFISCFFESIPCVDISKKLEEDGIHVGIVVKYSQIL